MQKVIRTAEEFFDFAHAVYEAAVFEGRLPCTAKAMALIYVNGVQRCRDVGNDALADDIVASLAIDI